MTPDPIIEACARVRDASVSLKAAAVAARAEHTATGSVSEGLWSLCDRLHDRLTDELAELERLRSPAGGR